MSKNVRVNKTITYEAFLSEAKRAPQRGKAWNWETLRKQVIDNLGDYSLEEGRGAISFAGEEDAKWETFPGLNMLVQALEPSFETKPHRHSNFAIFIVMEGQGCSWVEGEPIEWSKGDVFFAPAWAEHIHKNTSASDLAILYTIQNVPEVVHNRIWFFQGASGSGFVNNVKKDG